MVDPAQHNFSPFPQRQVDDRPSRWWDLILKQTRDQTGSYWSSDELQLSFKKQLSLIKVLFCVDIYIDMKMNSMHPANPSNPGTHLYAGIYTQSNLPQYVHKQLAKLTTSFSFFRTKDTLKRWVYKKKNMRRNFGILYFYFLLPFSYFVTIGLLLGGKIYCIKLLLLFAFEISIYLLGFIKSFFIVHKMMLLL